MGWNHQLVQTVLQMACFFCAIQMVGPLLDLELDSQNSLWIFFPQWCGAQPSKHPCKPRCFFYMEDSPDPFWDSGGTFFRGKKLLKQTSGGGGVIYTLPKPQNQPVAWSFAQKRNHLLIFFCRGMRGMDAVPLPFQQHPRRETSWCDRNSRGFVARVFGPLGRLDGLKYGHIPKLSSNTLKKNLPFCVSLVKFLRISRAQQVFSGFLNHRNDNDSCALLQVTMSQLSRARLFCWWSNAKRHQRHWDLEGGNAETFS